MIKKVILMSLCLCLLSLGSAKVSAVEVLEEELQETSSEIIPYMDNTLTSNCFLYINSNGEATTKCSISGYKGITTKVSITANLQQYKGGRWVNINTFTNSSNSFSTFLIETVNISKGYTYRVSAQVKAWSGSKVETRNLISNQNRY